MLVSQDLKFDLDDVRIIPDVLTVIEHRGSECDPCYKTGDFIGTLPLFVAPMNSVIDSMNYLKFIENGINPIIPRTESLEKRLEFSKSIFTSFGLNEIDEVINYIDSNNKLSSSYNNHYYVLIDVANGHMTKVKESVSKLKQKYHESISVMAGNIANPETYKILSYAGADYIRISIGNGGGCLTAQQLGIGYPIGSLITECAELKQKYSLNAKIVADGGMKKYADIITSLALGADYVMIGSLLNKTLESAGMTYYYENNSNNKIMVNQYDLEVKNNFINKDIAYYKEFYGMSTKKAQLEINPNVQQLKTSEGVIRENKVEYTLSGWTQNLIHYLCSMMSYCNKTSIEDFIGKVNYCLITENSIKRFRK